MATGTESVEMTGTHLPDMDHADAWSGKDQPGHVEVIQSEADPAVVKSFLRKCDCRLIPALALTYLFNSLDRANLGNAKTDGLEADLGMKGNQYNQIMTFYYVPFVLFGPVGALASRWLSAKYGLMGMMVVFGSCSLATAFVTNFSGLFATRFFLGMFEAGFLASVVVYMSSFWTRADIASRIGLFFASNVIASAFGGLLAYGTFQITGTKLRGWSYLFIIEGSLTIVLGIMLGLFLPKSLQTAKFLTPEEKAVGISRQLADSVDEVESKFRWSEALSEMKSWHTYIRIMIGFSLAVSLSSNNNFLAPMVARLGYGVAKTNLYTVAPAATAAVLLVGFCFSSDWFRERGLHLVAVVSLTIVGYVILLVVDEDNTGVGYFALFLTTIGAYPISPIFSAWCISNLPNYNSRAFTMGVILPVSNLAGFVASNVFINSEAPRYITALRVNLAIACASLGLTLSYTMWMRWENQRRDRAHGRSTITDNHGHAAEYITSGVLSAADSRFRFMP